MSVFHIQSTFFSGVPDVLKSAIPLLKDDRGTISEPGPCPYEFVALVIEANHLTRSLLRCPFLPTSGSFWAKRDPQAGPELVAAIGMVTPFGQEPQ